MELAARPEVGVRWDDIADAQHVDCWHAGAVQYRGQEYTFLAGVVAVESNGHAEMVKVRAVGPGGYEVRFACFAGEHEVGAVVEVMVRRA